MDQKWIYILVILVLYEKITSGAGEEPIQEGSRVEITCIPSETGSMVVWFRVLDKSGMEFIGSYSTSGMKKKTTSSPSSAFDDSKARQHILILKSFKKAIDSGVYSCASLYGGNELKFGQVTRLVGEKEAQVAQVATTTNQNLCTTATPCVCTNNKNKGKTSPSMLCAPIIWGPLAGGCGLLLLLLLVISLYCNTMRTRRCPHHYKRKPRMMAGGKPVTTNRHV